MMPRAGLDRNLGVCPECDHHHILSASDRIAQLIDPDTFEEWFTGLTSADPLGFKDSRPYPERLKDEQERTGLSEAAVVGQGLLKGIRTVLGVTDARFIMGSMGSVVGEKLARATEAATRDRLPLIIVSGSGGARMHEGTYSLMQMAKVAAALARYRGLGNPCLSVLTHPTLGGAASFAMLGDVILAEPGATVGYTSPKILSQYTRGPIPDGFQTSESLLAHGFIDRIVRRHDLRQEIAVLLDYLTPLRAQ